LKIAHDLLLFRSFRALKPPEEIARTGLLVLLLFAAGGTAFAQNGPPSVRAGVLSSKIVIDGQLTDASYDRRPRGSHQRLACTGANRGARRRQNAATVTRLSTDRRFVAGALSGLGSAVLFGLSAPLAKILLRRSWVPLC
jgi:hypothetical protein